MYISPSLIMGIALALLLAPWISAKLFHYCDLTDTANCMSILMVCEEDDCYFDMDEEDNMLSVSGKGCPCLHCYEQEQSVTYLCMTYYTFIVDCWPQGVVGV